MRKTFDYYRSTNSQLSLSKDQQLAYQGYLKRVNSIVCRQPTIHHDTSPMMEFRNECRVKARTHQSQQVLSRLNYENHILLHKILKVKQKEQHKQEQKHALAMHQKRARDQRRINEDNRKMAKRVVRQQPVVRNCQSGWLPPRESPQRRYEKSFYESQVKERPLPKLLKIRQ